MAGRTTSSCYIRGWVIRCFDEFCQLLVDREKELKSVDKGQEERVDRVYQAKVVDSLLRTLGEFSKN